jgi:hypothetical protein
MSALANLKVMIVYDRWRCRATSKRGAFHHCGLSYMYVHVAIAQDINLTFSSISSVRRLCGDPERHITARCSHVVARHYLQ